MKILNFKNLKPYYHIFIALFILIAFLIYFGIQKSNVVIGLLGVFIGNILSSFTNVIISKQAFKQQLSIAALDKKIETHQRAFSIWWDIKSHLYNKDLLFDIVINAQKWWKDNCYSSCRFIANSTTKL